MDYEFTANRPFDEIEARVIEALEQQGFTVQRTFSLHSVTGAGSGGGGGNPGYTVLLLGTPDAPRLPLAVITLYETAGRAAIRSVAMLPTADEPCPPPLILDIQAKVVAALTLGGLDFCVRAARGDGCVDAGTDDNQRVELVRDPVCGIWFSRAQAYTVIEHAGVPYFFCSPSCQAEFERDPERFAQVQGG